MPSTAVLSSLPMGLRFLGNRYYHRYQRHHNHYQLSTYRLLVLGLTFVSYAAFHMSRRPLSVVKNVFSRNCSQLLDATGESLATGGGGDAVYDDNDDPNWCNWEPFGGSDANTLLGLLDSSFLFSYAICMFVSGFLAERSHLRLFLGTGMLLSGLMTALLGCAYYYDIHSLNYFIVIQIICGAVQTTGWPAVVSSVSNWFGKSSRGLIFGIWNSHTNVGNIIGALIAGYYVETNWGLSFIVPALIIMSASLLVFLFFTPYPEEVGIASIDTHREVTKLANNLIENCVYNNNKKSMFNQLQQQQQQQHRRKSSTNKLLLNSNEGDVLDDEVDDDNDNSSLMSTTTTAGDNQSVLPSMIVNSSKSDRQVVSFMTALKIPGVIEFSLCLFFAKLVSYTFLYWLPKYIGFSTDSSSSGSAYLSTPFDLGGIVGAILAGHLVDRTGASALICIIMLTFAIPSLFLYQLYGSVCDMSNIVLQLIAGVFVNGPYALISTTVSAELGTKLANSQALAIVTAIIDGTGSIGAAIGPLLAGRVSQTGWSNVFYMVMLADLLALLSLLRIGSQEYKRLVRNNRLLILDNRYI